MASLHAPEHDGAPQTSAREGLAADRLGAPAIFFLVVAAAAPLAVAVASAPLSFRIGGIGAPGALLACGVVLLLFAMGLTAMSSHVRNTGAFYAYAAHGLGKPAGVGLAVVTLFAYGVLTVSLYGYLGYYAAYTAESLLGWHTHWALWAGGMIVVVAVLGYLHVDIGAKVLVVLLCAEIAILGALSVGVLLRGGPEPLSAVSFDPSNVFFASGSGALFVIGFGSYLGFEGTVVYAEEAKRPDRTIPRATYAAIGFLALFYGLVFWVYTAAFGVDGLLAAVHAEGFENLAFTAAERYLGSAAVTMMSVLVVTSFVACVISFHNATTRYLFALGREGLAHRAFGRAHDRLGTPHRASLLLSVVCVVAVTGMALSGADPYLVAGLLPFSAGVIGLVFAQAVAAYSVTGYFLRDRRGHHPLRVVVAPGLGAIGLTIGVILIVSRFDLVSGTEGWVNWMMIGPIPVLFVAGVVVGYVLKRRDPERYARLAESSTES